MADWVQLSREVVHQGPFLTLHRDKVVEPDGRSTGFYDHVIVEDAVRVVALDSHGQVAIVEDLFYLQRRRVRHLPGGGSGAGEEPQRAASRELEEETGVLADTWHALSVIDPLPAVTSARTHLFLATGLRPGRLHRDATEVGMTVTWIPLADAVDDVRSGRITEAGSVTALLLAQVMNWILELNRATGHPLAVHVGDCGIPAAEDGRSTRMAPAASSPSTGCPPARSAAQTPHCTSPTSQPLLCGTRPQGSAALLAH
ncbi:NUDIX domain-containing protein [Streptomyces turgidiscabies]